MKNKTTTYALLAVVLFIWGYIVYRIYQGISGDDVALPTAAVNHTTPKTQEPLVVNNYELSLSYRDPFLGKQTSEVKPIVLSQRPLAAVPKVPKQPVEPKVTETIDWNFIQFKGIMKNPTSNKMVSIVIINNTQYMLEEGAIGGGVKILKVYKDSLKVSYKNIKKTVTR